MADAMTRHAETRQAVVAQNTANSDTPGYRARDVIPFSELVEGGAPGIGLRKTRAAHLNGSDAGGTAILREDRNGASEPNGNSVSVELEMLKAVAVKRQHDQALAVYRSGLTLMRTATGRR
ncbi:FlgB family protein [Oceanicola sp. S124]|uniref:FlgB family protein n=1 Tax=Oceanicola sp. S124 TaxID=1042378 RepID=UPI0002FF12F5